MTHEEMVLVLTPEEDPQFARLSSVPHTVVLNGPAPPEIAELATVILHWSGPTAILRETFARCRQLRWIHSRGAGVDSRLFPELVESDVVLTNGRGTFSASLGEYALTAMLYFAKEIPRLRKQQTAHLWEPFDVEDIAGKTVGIVGYGDIGREVATRAHAMEMKVLALRRNLPSAPDPWIERYFGPAELQTMVALCDYVVLTAPLTPETRHLFGEAAIAAMKPSAVLINLGRGPVVDELALIKALERHRIRGAALDVVEQEPLPADSPLYQMDQVLLSPHCADNTPGWLDRAMDLFLDQYTRFQRNEPLRNIVNKHLGY